MRTLKILVACGIPLLISGCVVTSLHPLYTKKDLMFDSALVGTWTKKSGDESWTFRKRKGNAYDVTWNRKKTQPEPSAPSPAGRAYIGELGRIDHSLFLDMPLAEAPCELSCASFQFLVHMFFRIRIEGDVLRVERLKPEWLASLLREKDGVLPSIRVSNDYVLLTASTKELQGFMLLFDEIPAAWKEEGEFLRSKCAPPRQGAGTRGGENLEALDAWEGRGTLGPLGCLTARGSAQGAVG